MTSDKGCTVILPTYNEEANIGRMIGVLLETYPEFNILVMDDNSKDETINIVKSMECDRVKLIVRNPEDRGLSASIFDGIMNTKTEFFINMDSDFQHPPSALADIYNQMCNGSELSIGVRKDRSNLSSFIRWVGSWGAHYLAAFTLRLHDRKICSDIMSGLFGGKTDMCKETIVQYSSNFQMKGFKALFDLMKYVPKETIITESVFEFGERQGGESKLSSGIIISLLKQCDEWGMFLSKIAERIAKK